MTAAARTDTPRDEHDVLVVGSGIPALWLLDRLRAIGYRAALVTDAPLIDPSDHAGHGLLTLAREPAARAAWNAFLDGNGTPDLRAAVPVDDAVLELDLRGHLRRLGERLRRRDRSRARALAPGHVTGDLQALARHGRLGIRDEIALDVEQLARALLAAPGAEVHAGAAGSIELLRNGSGGPVLGLVAGGVALPARRIVFCDGGRQTALRQRLGLRRHAHRAQGFLVLRLPALPALHLHVLANDAASSFLVTTHATPGGSRCWLVGADAGAAGPDIGSVRETLAALLPELDWPRADWQPWSAAVAPPATPMPKRGRGALAELAAAHARVVDASPVALVDVPRLVQRIIALLPPPQRGAVKEAVGAQALPAFLPAPWWPPAPR